MSAARPAAAGLRPGWPERVTLHSLAWLAAGNAVGWLLATLLLFPHLGRLLGSLTYGRWVPVHLNLLLYGWCGLPLVALLFALYLPRSGEGPWPSLALGVWSGALLFGALSWLQGATNAKPFLDWTGTARWLWLANLVFLEGVLAAAFLRRNERRRESGSETAGRTRLAKGLLLAALAAVPAVMTLATSPRIYPPINPASGGPTGASLLGSTLGVLWIFLAAPWVLGLPAARGDRRRVGAQTLAALALHSLLFLALDHGDHSHHELGQIAALASLAVWWPLMARYLRRFRWPRGSRRWLAALAAWSALLLVTALATFLPGALEGLKFTNALVGHAHLAMAGLVTSFNVLLLAQVGRGTRLAGLFGARAPFVLWQGGCAAHVLSLMVLGVFEALQPGLAARGGAVVTAVYAVRWGAGAAMLAASALWLGSARARLRRAVPEAAREPIPGWTPAPAAGGARR
jgi:cytochrome c oxidase cbb3-type subunit 1